MRGLLISTGSCLRCITPRHRYSKTVDGLKRRLSLGRTAGCARARPRSPAHPLGALALRSVQIAELLAVGQDVSSELLVELLAGALTATPPSRRRFLLNGFPRHLGQLEVGRARAFEGTDEPGRAG
jgi:hypothetical protein